MEERPGYNVKSESSIVEGPPKTAILKLEGYIQTREARALQQELALADEKGVKRLILDMSAVQYVSSAALGLLVTYSNRKKSEEGTDSVAIVKLPKSTHNVLETLGLINMFVIFDEMETALSSFGVKKPRK